eukprot:9969_1
MNHGFFGQQRQHQNQTQQTQPNKINSYTDNDIDIDETKDIQQMPSPVIQPKQFQFDLDYKLEKKDQDDIISKVTIRGTFIDGQKYDVKRKIHGIDKKEKQMSPPWLSRQRENIAQGILIQAFAIESSVAAAMNKSEALKLCYQKLGMLTAQKKIEVKALMLFTEEEIKIIQAKMQTKIECMDLVTIVFSYFASQEMYLENEDFMDLLDDCITHNLYENAVCDIYNGIHQLMITVKSAQKFDYQFIMYQQNRFKSNAFTKLFAIFTQLESNVFRTYEVNDRLLSNIYVYAILDIYLTHLTSVVYDLMESGMDFSSIENKATVEHAASFGGSSLCSIQRIAYSRHLTPVLRKRKIFCQRYMLCQRSEKDKVPLEICYENMGGFYVLTPSLYPLGIRVLTCLATVLNRHLLLPAVSLPNLNQIIEKYINNQQNIEEFKSLYPPNILSKYNDDISTIYKQWMTFMCRKYINCQLKQADFGEVGLGLRDQFNFGHMQYIKNKKKKRQISINYFCINCYYTLCLLCLQLFSDEVCFVCRKPVIGLHVWMLHFNSIV